LKLVRACRRYIRGQLGPNEAFTGLGCDAQLIRRRLAVTIGNEFVRYFLALSETAEARAFNGADVNENVPSTRFRLNESEPFLRIEPLYDTGLHNMSFQEQLIERRNMQHPVNEIDILERTLSPVRQECAKAKSFGPNSITIT
jgi:hypothetical protein